MLAAREAHEAAGTRMEYGVKECVLSYGESALYLGVLGNPKDGRIPLKYWKVLVGEFTPCCSLEDALCETYR